MAKGIPLNETALILPGHGSTENSQSSQATRNLTEELRGRNIFAEVHSTFWKEAPHYRDVFRDISCKDIYVVPHFISEGYFTKEVIPRELGLNGKVTERDGYRIRYCDPVGNHLGMTDLLVRRAAEVTSNFKRDETSLLILGHGTGRNKNSSQAVEEQVEKIQALGGKFGEVMGVYLDEPPYLSDWNELTRFHNVVVLPYFIAEGLHFSRDLPEMLGVGKGAVEQPYEIQSRLVYYTQPVGGDPAMADFVIDQVKKFEEV